jgi:parvulin-like peptidyl-prolyl isomerase
VEALLELEPGEVSQPVRSGVGFHLLRLVEMRPPSTPPFEEIESQVYHEYVRRLGDQALRGYLDQLRQEGSVVIAPPAAD